MDVFHSKIHFLSSAVYWAQATRKSHTERRRIRFNSLTNTDSQLVSLTAASPSSNPPRMCCQSHFLKYSFPSCSCPESLMFPIVYSEISLPNFQSFPLSISIFSIQIIIQVLLQILNLNAHLQKGQFCLFSWEMSPPQPTPTSWLWLLCISWVLSLSQKCSNRFWLILALCREGN